MTNLFIPYELAVIAKQKGANEIPCLACYNIDKHLFMSIVGIGKRDVSNFALNNLCSEHLAAPLYQQIVDWFREKYELHITIHVDPTRIRYYYSIAYNPGYTVTEPKEQTYYEALNKAIEEAFKLI